MRFRSRPIAAPNAACAVSTVAANCQPNSRPNSPTPSDWTTGLKRKPKPIAIPYAVVSVIESRAVNATKAIPKVAPFQKS
jgi:hypothetical protein